MTYGTLWRIVGGLAALITMAAIAPPGASAQMPQIKVAAAIPGSITDQAFNQQVYEGLVAAKERVGVEIAHTEKVAQANQVEVMSDYARRGFGVVIGAGGEFIDAAKRVSGQFPKVTVVVLNGAPTKGIATMNFNNQQFGYVLGYAAGKTSKSGKAGLVAGQKIKAFLEVQEGFEKGMKKANPKAQILVTYTNDWDDVAKAKEAALAQIGQGADVVMPYLDNGIVGVMQAAKEKAIWAVGSITDLAKQWPEQNLASTVMDFKEAVVVTAELAKAGKLEKKDLRFGLGTKPGRLASISPKVPAELKAEIEKMAADMAAGKFKM
jgi:basic membrane protein A